MSRTRVKFAGHKNTVGCSDFVTVGKEDGKSLGAAVGELLAVMEGALLGDEVG